MVNIRRAMIFCERKQKGGVLMGAKISKRFRRILEAEKAIKEWGRKHLTEQNMEDFYAGKVKFPESIALLVHLRFCRKCDENFFTMLVEKDLINEGLFPLPKKLEPLPPKLKKALEKYRKKSKCIRRTSVDRAILAGMYPSILE